jgi:sugar transferase (PEP-CTERM system associated)
MTGLLSRRITWRSATLVTFDSALIAGAMAVGLQLQLGAAVWHNADAGMAARLLLTTLICQACLYYRDLYEFRLLATRSELIVRVLQSAAAMAVVLAALSLLAPTFVIGHGAFGVSALLVVAAVIAWRLAFEWVSRHIPARERLLLLGHSVAAVQLAQELNARTEGAIEVVGFVAVDGTIGSDALGTIEDIPAIVRARNVDRVVVNLADARGKLPMDKLLEMKLDGVRFDHLASVYEEYTGRIAVEHLRPSWLIFSEGFRKSRVLRAAKRLGDIGGALVALVLAAPAMVAVAIAVRVTSPGPVLYRQRRVGQDGRVFTLRKFRSMRQDAEAGTGAVWAGENDNRVTSIGRFLRRSHLDELPQLWNILVGDMSLVGPRPERPEFVRELTKSIPFYGQRHIARPGLTGWAQVCYSYGASVEDAMQKLQYDLFYIKHMSPGLDAYIAFRTIKNVLQGRGV